MLYNSHMSIEYKIIQKSNPMDRTSKKYYASANLTGETSTRELSKEIEQLSTVSGADVQAVLYALAEVIPRHLAEGKSVNINQIGRFRITIRSEGKVEAKDVNAHSIDSARIVFTPSRDLSNITKDLHYKKIE